jgi:hypothetical protein
MALFVMPVLGAGIHAFREAAKAWMAGPRIQGGGHGHDDKSNRPKPFPKPVSPCNDHLSILSDHPPLLQRIGAETGDGPLRNFLGGRIAGIQEVA